MDDEPAVTPVLPTVPPVGTTSVRFGVDPGELHRAAAAAREIGQRLRAAHDLALAAGEPHPWAQDPALAATARRAVAGIAAAARLGGDAASALEDALRRAAESYAASDTWWPR